MSDPNQGDRRNRAQSSATGRRRARILIPLGLLLLLGGIFTYILLMAQRGAEDDSEVYPDETRSAAVSVVQWPVLVRP